MTQPIRFLWARGFIDVDGNAITATSWNFTTVIGTPTGVSATNTAIQQNSISWTTVSGATSYNIYWATSTGVTTSTGTKITGATSPYTHTSLTSGTAYYYIVTAVNSGGESLASSEVNATAPTTLFTTQDKKLVSADAEASDKFGSSVAVSGNYIIVGASEEDAGGSAAGAAYIFYYDSVAKTWDAGTKIVAVDAGTADYFGISVAISGDYAVVGTKSASTYIFHRTGSNSWDSGTKIVPSDSSTYFGYPVSISGDYAIIGTFATCCSSGNDNAYVFHRTGTNSWDAGTILAKPDAGSWDYYFGNSVSINGNYAIVGDPGDRALGYEAGAAYIFYRDATTGWDSGTKIGATDASSSSNFGTDVAISSNYAVVTSNNGLYIFNRAGTGWDLSGAKLFTPQSGTTFGSSVAVDGENVIAGKYIFRNDSSGWNSGATITASDATDADNFGGSVSISGNLAVVGANAHDTPLVDAGTAYIFK